MVDKVSFVYGNDAGSPDEPVAMIVLKNGMLRFHAPNGSPYKDKISYMNGKAISLDEDDATEFFEEYSDRWNNQFSYVETFPMTGRNARKAEVAAAKWSKA
jgi:hypothetical protein